MGRTEKDGQSQGPKFAGKTENGIDQGDVILVARRSEHKPQIVGFGVVHGKYAKRLDDIKPPEKFGSLRRLQPFEPWSRPPSDIPLIDVLKHARALVQLYPEEVQRDPKKYKAHKEVCEWIDRKLGIKGKKAGKKTAVTTKSKDTGDISLVDLRENPQLDYDYTIQPNSKIRKAKASEDKLLHEYRDWLRKQDRKLSAAKYGLLRCDGYKEEHRNLIEAKSSITREHIRMAVGQLLDYAFQGRKKYGNSKMAILLPEKPEPEIEKWLQHLKISIVWRKGNKFLDNANGQFS